MDSLLDALQEGRLIELPENNKEHALQFLAHILEAIPTIPAGTDIVGLVMARERATGTAIGRGWACPHARTSYDDDLLCVVGWSPTGIDYGAPDGVPVSIIAMYLVPDNQRNHYLREVSMLAKALKSYDGIDKLRSAKELNEIREHLLDMVSATKETVGPDTRARMIQLQARHGVAAIAVPDLANLVVEPVTIVTAPGIKPVVLAQNRKLVEALDSAAGLVEGVASSGLFQNGGWRIKKRGTVTYQGDRVPYECLAIATAKGNLSPDK
jgi:mannitol/fructose-specific phosphotransferase system IIA component (Ntr-type)